jgi:Bacterial PH domain
VIFKRRFQQFGLALIPGIMALFVTDMSINAPDNPLGLRITDGVSAVVFAYVTVRSFQLAIVARPDQLVVRNIFRTVRISWENIARFEPAPEYGIASMRIRLRDGRVIAVTAFGNRNWDTGRVSATVIRELEQLRRQNSHQPAI